METGSCVAVATGHMGAVGAIAFARKTVNFIVTGSRYVFSHFCI